MSNEYPKMLYKTPKDKEDGRAGLGDVKDIPDKHDKSTVVVKNEVEQLEKQEDGYTEHDGSTLTVPETAKVQEIKTPGDDEDENEKDNENSEDEFKCDLCNDYNGGGGAQGLKMHKNIKHPETKKEE